MYTLHASYMHAYYRNAIPDSKNIHHNVKILFRSIYYQFINTNRIEKCDIPNVCIAQNVLFIFFFFFSKFYLNNLKMTERLIPSTKSMTTSNKEVYTCIDIQSLKLCKLLSKTVLIIYINFSEREN